MQWWLWWEQKQIVFTNSFDHHNAHSLHSVTFTIDKQHKTYNKKGQIQKLPLEFLLHYGLCNHLTANHIFWSNPWIHHSSAWHWRQLSISPILDKYNRQYSNICRVDIRYPVNVLDDRTLSDAEVQLPLPDKLVCKWCLSLKVLDIQKIGEVSLDDRAFVSHNDAILLGTHLLFQKGTIEIK